ncbi:MAG: transglycosylase SLT domain-containing protein [Proteobacteria bacterium]|nr:transglycosylase SLT domain-containing protein [Pseudomonadota bacterium]
MFLFSTQPGQQTQKAETPLSRPIAQAAQETGVSFDYLVKTAKRESGMNPEAKAPNSSATGLFQFIEQTWLGLVKRQGANMGLEDAASQITQDRSGRYVVPDPSARQQILALRKDPSLSSKMAGVFTAENRDSLKNALGRDPTGGELYIAHFMGAGGAREFISQAANNPDKAAASSFPDAAAANRSIFFDGKGRARTMREVYARLISHHEGEGAQVAAVAPSAGPNDATDAGGGTRSPLAIGPGGARNQNAFSGLFRSAGSSEGAQAMRKAWVGVAQNRMNANAPSFFPRGDGQPIAQVASLETPPGVLAKFEAQAPYEAVDLPLPPQRPAHLTTGGNAPLDLTRFTKNRR